MALFQYRAKRISNDRIACADDDVKRAATIGALDIFALNRFRSIRFRKLCDSSLNHRMRT